MTTPLRFEQDLPMLLEDLYVSGTPDYRDDLVQRIAATRQRPAWAFPERWLPMDFATQAVPTARMPWRALGVLALIALLIAASIAVYVGSQPRLPKPFGPAVNGPLVYTNGGDVFLRDELGSEPRAIVTGPEDDVAAWFSPRGDRLLVIRGSVAGEALLVGKPDGSDLIHVGGPYQGGSSVEFSPDGAWLAVAHVRSGIPVVELVATDGSRTVPVTTMPAMSPMFRPPDGSQLLFRGQGQDGRWGFYIVDVDGGEPDRLAIDGQGLEGGGFDLHWPSWSPTGDRLAYHTLVPLPESQGRTNGFRISVASVMSDGTVTRIDPLEFDPFSDDELNPMFTQDGDEILFQQRFGLLGTTPYTDAAWIAPASGGSSRPLGIESRDGDGLFFSVAPDDAMILVHLPREQQDWLVDRATERVTQTDLASNNGASWQRRGD